MMSFQLGGMTVYGYGLALAVSCAIAFFLMARSMRRAGLKENTASLVAVLSVPMGIFGARLFYCLIRWSWFWDQGAGFFVQLTSGGLNLYGAVFFVILAGVLGARLSGQKPSRVLDAMVIPGCVMLILEHLCVGIAGQGYGWTVGDWFSVDAFDAEEYTGMSLFHLEDVSFFEGFPFSQMDYYGEYHWSVFLLEALIAVLMLVVLLRYKPMPDGRLALIFMVLMAPAEAIGESMRQDAVLRWGFVRVGQLITVCVLLAVLTRACVKSVHTPIRKKVLAYVYLILCMGVFMAMEFALEKKIVFLAFMPMDTCYVVMGLSCLGMTRSVLPMVHRMET